MNTMLNISKDGGQEHSDSSEKNHGHEHYAEHLKQIP